jgi:ketosteroid isomerase-like protein
MADAERELREIVDERVAAVKAKDTAPLFERLHPEVVTFDVTTPLRNRGRDSVIERARDWFDGFTSDIGYDVHELAVSAEGDLGFCSFAYHVTGSVVSGDEVDMWVRATLCCRRVDGRWLVTHDHESVPFDPETGLAVIDLAPD